ncbi:hypothetical protein PB1_02525 [Bacillus methanolicus PB1]|uniref:Rad52/22 double-strand break repair protein n=1 Tax=Bacillus methanolicus PB1 TaxID=997296 RepID=I3E5K7_BACMT|nr:hypothetical protein [Bacillus methanolicus]EIJ81778.1 hypothetical protein PB1_02525 [Bacillus methanolicus PB1]
MDYNRLTRPFEPSQIRERQGKKNMIYRYVPVYHIEERLMELPPGSWSFVVKDHFEKNGEIAVLGSLTINGTTREAWGSSALEGKTLGDCMKSASALSLTKCASLFGVPCVFRETSISQQQRPQQQYQQPQQRQQEIKNVQYACMDCGSIISEAEVNFSKKYADTFFGKTLCRECQQFYRNNQIRRVK